MSGSALVMKGEWFEGPSGTAWKVVDPYAPLESDETLVPFVWLEAASGGDRWVEVETFDDWIAAEDFISIDSPESVATDGGVTFSCEHCDGDLGQIDEYEHDLDRVEIFRCGDCDATGALITSPNGDRYQRGCVDVGATPIHVFDVTAPFRWLAGRLSDRLSKSSEGKR